MHHTQTHSEIHKATKSILEFLQFRRPPLVFCHDLQQLHRIQQVVQGIGAVPELMLPPEAEGDREKEELVQVRAGGGDEIGAAGREVGPPSPKKPDSVQRASSRVSFRQEAVSCSSSGQDQEAPCITGW